MNMNLVMPTVNPAGGQMKGIRRMDARGGMTGMRQGSDPAAFSDALARSQPQEGDSSLQEMKDMAKETGMFGKATESKATDVPDKIARIDGEAPATREIVPAVKVAEEILVAREKEIDEVGNPAEDAEMLAAELLASFGGNPGMEIPLMTPVVSQSQREGSLPAAKVNLQSLMPQSDGQKNVQQQMLAMLSGQMIKGDAKISRPMESLSKGFAEQPSSVAGMGEVMQKGALSAPLSAQSFQVAKGQTSTPLAGSSQGVVQEVPLNPADVRDSGKAVQLVIQGDSGGVRGSVLSQTRSFVANSAAKGDAILAGQPLAAEARGQQSRDALPRSLGEGLLDGAEITVEDAPPVSRKETNMQGQSFRQETSGEQPSQQGKAVSQREPLQAQNSNFPEDGIRENTVSQEGRIRKDQSQIVANRMTSGPTQSGPAQSSQVQSSQVQSSPLQLSQVQTSQGQGMAQPSDALGMTLPEDPLPREPIFPRETSQGRSPHPMNLRPNMQEMPVEIGGRQPEGAPLREPAAGPSVPQSVGIFQQSLQEAAAPVSESPSAQPTGEDFDVPRQIVEQARLIRSQENTEMVIRLKPEHLGNLTLRVSVSGSGAVTASFYTDNAQVRSIVENSLVQLRQELENQGIKVDKAEVYAGLPDGQLPQDQGQQAWQQHQGQGSASSFRNTRGDMDTFEETTAILSTSQEEIPGDADGEDGVDYRV